MKTLSYSNISKIFAALALTGSIAFTNNVSAQNLLINPGFTDGTTGWSTDCSIEINPENVYGGVSTSNSVTEIDVERCFNQQVSVNAGATYNFGYKASRRQGGTPATVGVNVTVTGVQSGVAYINANRTYSNTTWSYTNEAFSFTLPLNAIDSKVNVKFANYATSGTYGTIVDDINLSVGSSGVLPIRFLGFSGRMKNNAAVLNWTASNDDNSGKTFIIERSVNQGSYAAIATVNASANVTAYAFTDKNASGGANYYRIKAVNANGTSSYSNIICLDNNASSTAKLYPNPATSTIGLSISVTENTTATVQIYSISGNMATAKKIALNEGSNAISMDITSLGSGAYYLKVADNNGLNFVQSFNKK